MKALASALTLLVLTTPAQAVALAPLPAQTLSFPAGKDMQPVAFSPDGGQLLTFDAAGFTLWQVGGMRPLWRSAVHLDWFPWEARWEGEVITVWNPSGQQVQLQAATGREIGRGRRQLPSQVLAQLGLTSQAGLHSIGSGIWQDDPGQPVPFEIAGGQLAGFYAEQSGLLALKRPGTAPAELWSAGKLVHRLDTLFPASAFGGPDSRFVPGLSFSPDGHWLAWSSQKRVTIWDTGSGKKVAVLRPDPYRQDFDHLRVLWNPAGDSLLVYSRRNLWRYRTPAAGQRDAAFALLEQTPAPKDALIRTVSVSGTLASGTGSALLISQAGTDSAQALGPVPQRVFFSEDGRATLVLSWPFLWVFRENTEPPLAVRLPDYAEAEWMTLQGRKLTVYGRNLSWVPGAEPDLHASIWTADLPPAAEHRPLSLALEQEDRRLNCGSQAAGQWVTSVLQPVRLCQQEKQLSGDRAGQPAWSLELDGAASPLVSPDGRWFAPQPQNGLLRIFRSETGQMEREGRLPELPKDTFWSPALRVDTGGRWAAVQAGQQWYLADLRAGTAAQAVPELEGAADITFVGDRLAVVRTDQVVWFTPGQ